MAEENIGGLSKELSDKIRFYIQDHSAPRVVINLRIVWFDYLRFQTDGLHVDFDNILNDIESLFELLEVLSEQPRITKAVE